jgi:hypothetical protein
VNIVLIIWNPNACVRVTQVTMNGTFGNVETEGLTITGEDQELDIHSFIHQRSARRHVVVIIIIIIIIIIIVVAIVIMIIIIIGTEHRGADHHGRGPGARHPLLHPPEVGHTRHIIIIIIIIISSSLSLLLLLMIITSSTLLLLPPSWVHHGRSVVITCFVACAGARRA